MSGADAALCQAKSYTLPERAYPPETFLQRDSLAGSLSWIQHNHFVVGIRGKPQTQTLDLFFMRWMPA